MEEKYSNIQNHLTSSQFCPRITFFLASLLLASISRYTLLHGVLFPIEQKPPIHPLGQSLRCCGMSPWPLGYTARGGSQLRFVAHRKKLYHLHWLTPRVSEFVSRKSKLFVRPELKFWFYFWFRNILKVKCSILQLWVRVSDLKTTIPDCRC